MSHIEPLTHLRQLIAQDRWDELWPSLRDVLNAPELRGYQNERDNLEGRWNQLRSQQRQGTLSQSELSVAWNRLRSDVLALLEQVEQQLASETGSSQTPTQPKKPFNGETGKRTLWRNAAVIAAIITALGTIIAAFVTGGIGSGNTKAEPYRYPIQLASQDGKPLTWAQSNPRVRIYFADLDASFSIEANQTTIELPRPIGVNPVKLELVNGQPYQLCVSTHPLKEGKDNLVALCLSPKGEPSQPPPRTATPSGPTPTKPSIEPEEDATQTQAPALAPRKAFVAIACREAHHLELDGQKIPLTGRLAGYLTFSTTAGPHTLSVWDQYGKALMKDVALDLPADSMRLSSCGPQPIMQTLKSFRQNFQ